jgi:hypothetical protein
MSPTEQAAEFQRRRNLVGTTVRYISEKRSFNVYLSNRGTELGSRTDILKRGKVVSVLYFLPPVKL